MSSGTAGAAGAGGVQASQITQAGASGDLMTMFMLLAEQRTNIMDSVIQGMSKDMADRNEQINQLNEAMMILRNKRPGGKADKEGTIKYDNDMKKAYAILNGGTAPDGTKYPGMGVPPPGSVKWDGDKNEYKATPGNWDKWIENVKTKIDTLSSSSQMDMIKLQGMINKRNQTIEMASNIMQKISKALDGVIANLR